VVDLRSSQGLKLESVRTFRFRDGGKTSHRGVSAIFSGATGERKGLTTNLAKNSLTNGVPGGVIGTLEKKGKAWNEGGSEFMDWGAFGFFLGPDRSSGCKRHGDCLPAKNRLRRKKEEGRRLKERDAEYVDRRRKRQRHATG